CRAQSHFRRCLRARSRLLLVLSVDAGLRSRVARQRHAHAAQARLGVLSLLRGSIGQVARGRRSARQYTACEVTADLRYHGGTGLAKMAEFIAAIGLVLVIEGLLFAAFPRAAKRLAASALESPKRRCGSRALPPPCSASC